MSGGEEAVPHPPPPSLPGSHEEEEGSSPSKVEPCLNHLKNDSGSYDGGSELLKTSSSDKEGLTNISNGRPPTILISNGNDDPSHLAASGGSPTASPKPHPHRTTSSASVYSEGRGSVGQSSSSSSFDFSQASSRELLEQLVAESNAMEKNEVVKQLLEHIVVLKLELEEMKMENTKLKGMRSTMDDELSTLTENLFEEAYKMVDSAKEEKGVAVKRLADASGKIDAMETEMSALKSLLHTPSSLQISDKTPSSSPHHSNPRHRKSVKKAFKKLTRKVKLTYSSSSSSSSKASSHGSEMPLPLTLVEHKNEIKGAALNEGEMMPSDFSEFSDWLAVISSEEEENHPYLAKVEEVDVIPCLSFSDKKLSSLVLLAARKNDLLMESLGPCSEEEEHRVCVLSGCDEVYCTHRLKLGSSDQWIFISAQCRDRIAAACDFYMYIGHIEKGILKLEATQLYWQVARLRAMMTLARLTLHLPE